MCKCGGFVQTVRVVICVSNCVGSLISLLSCRVVSFLLCIFALSLLSLTGFIPTRSDISFVHEATSGLLDGATIATCDGSFT